MSSVAADAQSQVIGSIAVVCPFTSSKYDCRISAVNKSRTNIDNGRCQRCRKQ
jgi:hypothetical protein